MVLSPATVRIVLNSIRSQQASVGCSRTLTGNVLTWNTPTVAKSVELDDTHLGSTLTFTFTAEITVNCSDTTASNSSTLVVERIVSTRAPLALCNL